MDELTERLRRDAANIDAAVSEELEHRIDASLRAVVVEAPTQRQPVRPALFWWASSATGVVAAIAVIAFLNVPSRDNPDESGNRQVTLADIADIPTVEWKARSAMLTGPLRQELEDLQSDLKRAEDKVREDIGL